MDDKLKIYFSSFMIFLSIIEILKLYIKNNDKKRKLEICRKIIWITFLIIGILLGFELMLEFLEWDIKDFIKFMKM